MEYSQYYTGLLERFCQNPIFSDYDFIRLYIFIVEQQMIFLDLLNKDYDETYKFTDGKGNEKLVKDMNENEILEYSNCVKVYYDFEKNVLCTFYGNYPNVNLDLLLDGLNVRNSLDLESSEKYKQKFLDFVTEKFNKDFKK